MKASRWYPAVAAVAALGAIEGAYFLGDGSAAKRIAAWAWLGIAVGMLAFAGVVAAIPFSRRRFWSGPSRWWYLAAAGLPLLLLYFGVTGTVWTPCSPEGVAENVVGADLFRDDPDLGVYTAAYHARYVGRQYVLASLPTLVFGPSFAALRVGNSLIYVVGYLAFLATLAGYLEARRVDGWFWSAWAGMTVALGTYPLMVARMFEQTVMPLGATLMIAAALLHHLRKPGPGSAAWIAWAMGFLTCGYTPAYGTWALAAAVLVYLARRPPAANRVLLLALAHGLAALVVAGLILGQGGQLARTLGPGTGELSWSGWLWRYAAGFAAVCNSGGSVVPAPLGMAALALLFGAAQRRDGRVLFVFLWCGGIVLASLTLMGSWFDRPASEVHRAMIILPVIAAGVVGYGAAYFPGPMNSGLLRQVAACSMVYLAGTSLSIPLLNRWRVVEDREMTDFDEAALRLSEVAHDPRRPAIRELCVVPPLTLNTFDLGAGLAYFFPGARFVQDAVPLPGPGSYRLEYNDRPRDADYRSPAKRQQPYLSLREEPDTAASAQARQRIRDSRGLVADYRFREGAGPTAADQGGNAEPAQLAGGADGVPWGPSGTLALTGRHGYLTLPGLPVATRALTVALWVKGEGSPGEQGILKLGTPVAGSTCLYLSTGAPGDRLRLTVDVPVPPNLAEHAEIDAPRPPARKWALLATVLTGDEAILWVDGAPAGSVRVNLEDPDLLRGHHNWIGHSLGEGPDFLGAIAGLRIYGRALGAEEIAALARAAPP